MDEDKSRINTAIERRASIQINLTKLRRRVQWMEELVGRPGMPEELLAHVHALRDGCRTHLVAASMRKQGRHEVLVDLLATTNIIGIAWSQGWVMRAGKKPHIVSLEERIAVVAILAGFVSVQTSQVKDQTPAKVIDVQRSATKKIVAKWQRSHAVRRRAEIDLRDRGVTDLRSNVGLESLLAHRVRTTGA